MMKWCRIPLRMRLRERNRRTPVAPLAATRRRRCCRSCCSSDQRRCTGQSRTGPCRQWPQASRLRQRLRSPGGYAVARLRRHCDVHRRHGRGAAGYQAQVLITWGDPVSDGPAFKQDGTNTAAEQAQQWGMHNDGVVYFPLDGSKSGLIVQNHEYTDDGLLFADNIQNWDAEKQRSRRTPTVSESSKCGGVAPRGRWCDHRSSLAESRARHRCRSQVLPPATTC